MLRFPPHVGIWLAAVAVNLVTGHIIVTTNNGPIVRGATIQFHVKVFEDNGKLASGNFQYFWKDLKFPENNASFESSSPESHWNLTCGSQYKPGTYMAQILVYQKKHEFFLYLRTKIIGNKTVSFDVTRFLNGNLVVLQANTSRTTFVDSSLPLNQSVVINSADMQFLNRNKNFVMSFWFIDCVYYGQQREFNYQFNYSKPESKHLVQALVVATNRPVNFTLLNFSSTVNATNKNVSSNNNDSTLVDADRPFKEWLLNFNQSHLKGNSTLNNSNTCINVEDIPLNDNYTYGLFDKKFTVKDPVRVSPINGTNWLMDGEILNITVSCTGSSPFKYCLLIFPGLYNVTGKETCEEELLLTNCSFNIHHLFTEDTEYTIVVFISNSVSQVIKPIAVNIYKVTKHPQLSVIIVPVAFSMVAVILIIFGVAYYVQSKRSYTVEVADFDFANQSSDMEYKSFGERLRESVSNLFLKSNDFDDDDDDEQVWSPSRKYGSMQ